VVFYLGLVGGTFLVVLVASLMLRGNAAARPWIAVAVVGAAAAPVAAVLHNVVSAVLGVEEALFFVVALAIAPATFAVGALGTALSLWRAGQEPVLRSALLVAGLSTITLAVAALLALGSSMATRAQPGWVGTTWQIAELVATTLVLVAVFMTTLAVVRRAREPSVTTA
jgi:hypothetical protein